MKTASTITRHLTLSLLVALFLTCSSCEKEEDSQPVKAELLEGNWIAKAINISYYNSAGTIAHQERQEITGVTYDFREGTLTVYSVPDKNSTSVAYRLTRHEDKDYISFTANGETREYQILKLTKEELVWQGNYFSTSYIKDGERRSAASAKYTQEFRR